MIGHCRNKHNEHNLGLPRTIHFRIRLKVYLKESGYYVLRLAYQSHTHDGVNSIFIT
jgi:hypothetical protein